MTETKSLYHLPPTHTHMPRSDIEKVFLWSEHLIQKRRHILLISVTSEVNQLSPLFFPDERPKSKLLRNVPPLNLLSVGHKAKAGLEAKASFPPKPLSERNCVLFAINEYLISAQWVLNFTLRRSLASLHAIISLQDPPSPGGSPLLSWTPSLAMTPSFSEAM